MEFERPARAGTPRNTRDDRGTIKVMIVLQVRGAGGFRPSRGNIVRTFTVANAKVSQVAQRLKEAVFPTSL